MQMDNPRQTAKKLIKNSVLSSEWENNEKFVKELCDTINKHRITKHPVIENLNNGLFSIESMKQIHLEYRHAIVQIFTDALLMAQHQSRQVEPRLAPGSKMSSCFLLTLNDLDEFWFRPGTDSNGYYRGNPALAHYPLFESLLNDYGISINDRSKYQPSDIADITRNFLEDSYHSFPLLVALLAVAEAEVVLFSPPLRKNCIAVGLDVEDGYYSVHGSSDEEDVNAYDDVHDDDLWHIVKQAVEEKNYDDIREKSIKYCDIWCDFWDQQLMLLEKKSKAA